MAFSMLIPALLQTEQGHRPGGEVNLQLPDLNQGDFLGFTGHEILMSGLVVSVLGLLFGLLSYANVKKLPVHKAMADVSELIYETCKAYLTQQGKFLCCSGSSSASSSLPISCSPAWRFPRSG